VLEEIVYPPGENHSISYSQQIGECRITHLAVYDSLRLRHVRWPRSTQ